ncbi:MAG: transglycosylase domain-containing protein [Polaromonas sp.]|nr:transglycosylase domain-containing protein [Polaromonas sp.]
MTLTDRLKQFVTTIPDRLRHATRREIAVGVAWAIAAIPLLLLLYTLVLIPFTPSISDLRKAKTAKPSVVMSADGQELAVFKRANRDWVKLADISPHVVAALIATEDHRFYEHHGMDLKRTFAAVLHTASGNKQGGSTITQQLARNLYPEDIGRAPTLTRKLKEAITSLKIEAIYTKDEILETYLNTVPFLYNAFGIEMAARTYFDKSADTLNVLESATLVGMLKGTSYYNPVLNPERAFQRRNTVLDQMVKREKLPEAKLAALKKTPLKIDFERQDEQLGAAPHFTQQLKRWLIEWADRNDYNIYADGLVLRTTIDSRLQDMANKSLELQTDRLQKISDAEWASSWVVKAKQAGGGSPRKDLVLAFVRDTKEYKAAIAGGQTPDQALKALQFDPAFMQKLRDDKTRLQAGFLALDPSNGHVMAWVGSRDFMDDQFDHVQQARRQPGSTFKPFVYGAAFENGSKPSDTFTDQALEIALGDGNFWRPGDAGGPSGATMTLREGLMYSKNSITAQVMQVVGPAHVAKLAKSMGVRQSKLDEVLSLALGTSPVTLKEMVTAYSTLANEGRYIEPIMITSVNDRNGRVLEAFQDKVAETVMATPVAQTLLDVMRGAIDQGTGAGIRSRYGIRADVAGKTGTTQDNTDGWFILMHPQLVAGAWVGFNDNRVTMGSRWGQGAQSALPIVGEFYRLAIRGKVVDQNMRFVAPRLAVPEPQPDPQLDANGQPLGDPGALLDPLAPRVVRPPTFDAGAAPEGSWQLSPGIRYITVQEQAPPAVASPQGFPVPLRDLPPEQLRPGN